MKSFNDFLDSIDNDELVKEIKQIVIPSIVVTKTTPEAISACINEIFNQAVAASVNVSLMYLRRYHEWLEQ